MDKKFSIAIGIAAIFAAVFIANRCVDRQLQDLNAHQPMNPSAVQSHIQSKQTSSKVVRKMHLDPNRKYYENRVYAGEEQIAFFKSHEGEMFDFEGNIPNGKVHFKNSNDNTYGTEYFFENERHGLYEEYYENGILKKKAQYSNGEMVVHKQYYYDGSLRMEIDLSDAMVFSDDSEVGVGKIYYKSGILMYEWNMTNLGRDRFKKAYDIEGNLVEVRRYDEDGNELEVINYRDQRG